MICYGGSIRLLKARAERGHFSYRLVDQSKPKAAEAALVASSALVPIEMPSNPITRVIDIASFAAPAHAVGLELAFRFPVCSRLPAARRKRKRTVSHSEMPSGADI